MRTGAKPMRNRDHVEIIAIAVPVLAEAVAVMFAVGVAAIWVLILSGRMELPV
jgi:hypothetical protein